MRLLLLGRRAAVLVLALAASACAGGNLGGLGDILAGAAGLPGSGGQQDQVVAEIQGLDTGRQLIQVRTQDGRTGSLLYDQNTVVVYQQRQYQVTNLERGDVVAIQVRQDTRGNAYASRIDVQQSVQERTGQSTGGVNGGVQELTGRVGQIDHQRGWFQLQTAYGGTVTVTLPYNPGSTTLSRFNRLRSGDTVRLQGTPVGNGRVELYRFV
ncbi:MAG TPA: hypothetical protein VHG51_13955 [Longimicrobiaceae bacterium]|nr:hypothetical protein [Longimicrobiaceae bacterium]